MRRALKLAGWLFAALILILVVGLILLPRIELAPLVAARASAALGREVAIERLRLTPGRVFGVELQGVRLANIPGGTAPDMLRLERLSAVLSLLPLLRGAVVIHDAEAEGFTLLLERDSERRRNWRFGSGAPRATRSSKRGLPVVHALRLTRSEIVVRTSAGARLATRIDHAALTAADPMVASTVHAQGAYNGAPLTARLDFGALDLLRDGQALPVKLHGRSGETTLDFEGTARDLLNFDGAEGRLRLRAPTPEALLRIAQVELPITLDIAVAGHATRDGDRWRLRDVEGSLFDAPFSGRLLELNEGNEGEPDAIVAELDFQRIDVNRIIGARPAGNAGGDRDADMPLSVPQRPDPRLDVQLTAREFALAGLDARDVSLKAFQHPGRIAIEELLLTAFGGRFRAAGALTPAEQGARLEAAAALLEGDLEAFQRAFGTHPLPLAGPLQGRFAVAAQGRTLGQARDQAKVAAVLTVTGGTVSRALIEMASTDVRALFRTAPGNTAMTCLLAVIEMEGRRGEASPLRIRAATGTVVGQGRFDLNRRTLDMVIGSQRDTTDFFALDIPIRVHGSFADPNFEPSDWSPAARTRLAGDDLSGLPDELAAFARDSACYRAPRRR
jgi:uncharacterized protein involved in outer membrane biogenesis